MREFIGFPGSCAGCRGLLIVITNLAMWDGKALSVCYLWGSAPTCREAAHSLPGNRATFRSPKREVPWHFVFVLHGNPCLFLSDTLSVQTKNIISLTANAADTVWGHCIQVRLFFFSFFFYFSQKMIKMKFLLINSTLICARATTFPSNVAFLWHHGNLMILITPLPITPSILVNLLGITEQFCWCAREVKLSLFSLSEKVKILQQVTPTNKILTSELYSLEVQFMPGSDLPQNASIKSWLSPQNRSSRCLCFVLILSMGVNCALNSICLLRLRESQQGFPLIPSLVFHSSLKQLVFCWKIKEWV